MARSAGPLRVLLSCVGRRVELVRAFRVSAKKLGIRLSIWGADLSASAPALAFVDRAAEVPEISDARYLGEMLRLVEANKIDLLIPLIDDDLLPLARAAPRFAACGCRVVISEEMTVATCRDKLKAFAHLCGAKIDTPQTWSLRDALAIRRHRFPYFVKPISGSASIGLHKIDNLAELKMVGHWVENPIVQEHITGDEYTLDVYTGFDGKPHCVVPRNRIRVRGGEVVESQIALDKDLIAVGRRVVNSLPGCRGVVTIQVIREASGRIAVIEINPRFGGGIPLSIKAGADMPGWLMAEHMGRRPRIPPTVARTMNGLMMIRYDESRFRRDGDWLPT